VVWLKKKYLLRNLFNILNANNILNMDNGTTSIDSLPISPQTQNNIQLEMTENVRVDNPSQQLQKAREEDPAAKQRNLNQFVTGLQQASSSGMTALPSRDIPQSQDHLTQDPQMKPNFIPNNQAMGDYILNHQTSEDIIRENARRQTKTDSLDELYNEMQIPILIGVLYFLFQLPVVRKNIFKYVPSLFHKDGNYNLSGYILNSVMFAGLYFTMTKGIKHFSF
jgi:hypothetical protein